MYGLDTFERIAIWSVLGIAILGLLYAVFLRYQVLKEDKGTREMQDVWNAIREGANAYLRRQLVTILPLILILTIVLFASIYIVPPTSEASVWYCMAIKKVPAELAEQCVETLTVPETQQIRTYIGIGRALAFVLGAGFSLAVGQIGMRMAVQGMCALPLQPGIHLVTRCALLIVLGRSPACSPMDWVFSEVR